MKRMLNLRFLVRLQNLTFASIAIAALLYTIYKIAYATELHKAHISSTADHSPNPNRYLIQPPIPYRTPYQGPFNRPALDPPSKVIYCWIPKVACTQFKALFCRRNNLTQIGIAEARHHRHHYVHFECFPQTPLYTPSEDEPKMTAENWLKWASIRDPVDRFLSAYVDKCIVRPIRKVATWCYGCKTMDLGCFLERNYDFLRNISEGEAKTHLEIWELTPFASADHFEPQYWFCGFYNYLESYELFAFSKNETYQAQIRKRFSSIGFEDEIVRSGWGENGQLPFLAPIPNAKNRSTATPSYSVQVTSILASNCSLTQLLLRTYWIDYVRFASLGFRPPDWAQACCAAYGITCEEFVQMDVDIRKKK